MALLLALAVYTRALVHILDPNGGHDVLRLGLDLVAGERPVVAVPRGTWQAAEIVPGIPFAFGSNVCAPPFAYDDFAIARRTDLQRTFPQHADLIRRLTREE